LRDDSCVTLFASKYLFPQLFDKVSAFGKTLLSIASIESNFQVVKNINENFKKIFDEYNLVQYPSKLSFAVKSALSHSIIIALKDVCSLR
jgi:hypothetical protein